VNSEQEFETGLTFFLLVVRPLGTHCDNLRSYRETIRAQFEAVQSRSISENHPTVEVRIWNPDILAYLSDDTKGIS
jgi:hypothetical protein